MVCWPLKPATYADPKPAVFYTPIFRDFSSIKKEKLRPTKYITVNRKKNRKIKLVKLRLIYVYLFSMFELVGGWEGNKKMKACQKLINLLKRLK